MSCLCSMSNGCHKTMAPVCRVLSVLPSHPPARHPRSEVDEMLERMSVNAKLSGQAWPDNVGGQKG